MYSYLNSLSTETLLVENTSTYTYLVSLTYASPVKSSIFTKLNLTSGSYSFRIYNLTAIAITKINLTFVPFSIKTIKDKLMKLRQITGTFTVANAVRFVSRYFDCNKPNGEG